MPNQPHGQTQFWTALIFGLLCATSAPAMDPACQAVLASQAGLKNKPFHMYMTSESKYASATFSRAAASIGIAGVKKSEEIWTGKDVYVSADGKWIDMHTSFAETGKSGENDRDIKKARDAEQCKSLPDESAFGQPAAVYQTHNPELGVDAKIWVSKTSHLPIKSEMTTNVGPMTQFDSARYEFGNVQPPANAISMSEMIKKK